MSYMRMLPDEILIDPKSGTVIQKRHIEAIVPCEGGKSKTHVTFQMASGKSHEVPCEVLNRQLVEASMNNMVAFLLHTMMNAPEGEAEQSEGETPRPRFGIPDDWDVPAEARRR